MIIHCWSDPDSRIAVFFLRGSFTVSHSQAFLEQASEKVSSGRARILVDLGKVTAMDSAGIGSLLALSRRLSASRGELFLSSPSPAVARGLGIMSLDDLFQVLPGGVREGLAHLASKTAPGLAERFEAGVMGDGRLKMLVE